MGGDSGPKLRTFKLNGKPEKSTFLEYLVDDGHDKFLEDLSAGAKNNGYVYVCELPAPDC